MGFNIKKIGRKLNVGGAKKIGKKFSGDIGKIGKKGGRGAENIGKLAFLAGETSGIAPLSEVGMGLMAGGQLAQQGGQVFRDIHKNKLEKASKGAISLAGRR